MRRPPGTRGENATISQGTVATNHTGFSGSGFVDYTNVTGSCVEWAVNLAAAGSTGLTIRYANGRTINRPMNITVNGAVVASGLAFNPTGNWDTWATTSITATLNAGANTTRASATTSNGGPNVDKPTVGGGGPTAAALGEGMVRPAAANGACAAARRAGARRSTCTPWPTT
jgi:chitinase